MSVWTNRPLLRWLVPGIAVALVLGGGAAASAITAQDGGEPDLPPRSAAELLADLHESPVGSLSGTLVQTADLGLPALPDTGHHGGADLGSLWSGSNTLRVWYDGPERARLALLDTLSQADIIRNGEDLWIWESSENKATHRVLPEGATLPPSMTHGTPPTDPLSAAEAALAAIEPTTEVSSEDTTRVAGRDAYELVLAPRDEASLIDEIRIAIDAAESIPLAVEVYGSDGTDPAFEVRFTQISFEAPDPEQFEFNPPPGATVTEAELLPELPFGEFGDWGERPQLTVVGEGWTSVLVVRLPAELELGPLEWLLSDGGGLSSNLLSVLLTDDGRVLVGAVTPERLAEVADDPAAALEGE